MQQKQENTRRDAVSDIDLKYIYGVIGCVAGLKSCKTVWQAGLFLMVGSTIAMGLNWLQESDNEEEIQQEESRLTWN